MSSYIKQLEEDNEKLSKLLAKMHYAEDEVKELKQYKQFTQLLIKTQTFIATDCEHRSGQKIYNLSYTIENDNKDDMALSIDLYNLLVGKTKI